MTIRSGARQGAGAGTIAIAVCVGLVSSVLLIGIGGGISFDARRTSQLAPHAANVSANLDGLLDVQSQTLALVQRASSELSTSEADRQRLRQAEADLEAAKQRAAELEKEKERLEEELGKGREALQAELNTVKAQVDELKAERERLQKEVRETEDRYFDLESKLGKDGAGGKSGPEAKQLEEEAQRLRGENGMQWTDMLTAATADKVGLGKYLAAHPEWLEQRKAEIKKLPQRGIVIAAADAALNANAFVNIHLLRHSLGCKLPITIMYWGEEENVGESLIKFFEDHKLNVSFVDASKLTLPLHQRPLTPRRLDGRFYGWKPKVGAIYTAPFQEVLFLDADSMPLMDPTFLFDWPEFKAKGNIIWPEHHAKEVELFRHFGLHNPWADASKKAEWPLVAESGQLLINRLTHPDVLEWLWFLNTHDEVSYRLSHGDKDTFRAAFDLAGKQDVFYQSPYPSADGLKDTGSTDLRYFKHALVQLAPNGSALFSHRVWFNKYDPQKDELRSFEYLTIENSGGRADVMRQRWGLKADQVKIVTEAECNMDFADMPGSQKACGFDMADESLPIPIFPIPDSSYVAKGLRGGDDAFLLLRKAVKDNALVI